MAYLFKCKKCKTKFEISASFSTITTLHPFCPVCKSDQVVRKYSPIPFVLRGKGFYKTDNGEKKDE